MSQNVLTLLLFLAPLVYSPGPGNLFFAALGARFGWRGTLLANLGYHAATLLMSMMHWLWSMIPMRLVFLDLTVEVQLMNWMFEIEST